MKTFMRLKTVVEQLQEQQDKIKNTEDSTLSLVIGLNNIIMLSNTIEFEIDSVEYELE